MNNPKLKQAIQEAVAELTANIADAVMSDINNDRMNLSIDSGGIDLFFNGEILQKWKWEDLLMDGVTSEIECGCVAESPDHYRQFSAMLKTVAGKIDDALNDQDEGQPEKGASHVE